MHAWLDALFPTQGVRHRIFRHNLQGIEFIREQYGDEAAEAARIHIIRDFGLPDVPDKPYCDIPVDQRQAEVVLTIWLQEIEKQRADPLNYYGKDEDKLP